MNRPQKVFLFGLAYGAISVMAPFVLTQPSGITVPMSPGVVENVPLGLLVGGVMFTFSWVALAAAALIKIYIRLGDSSAKPN
jgi:hypothetical protein